MAYPHMPFGCALLWTVQVSSSGLVALSDSSDMAKQDCEHSWIGQHHVQDARGPLLLPGPLPRSWLAADSSLITCSVELCCMPTETCSSTAACTAQMFTANSS